MCILLYLDEAVHKCRLYLVDWWFFWVHLCLYWLYGCSNCPFLINVEDSKYIIGFIYLTLHFFQFLPHVFWVCDVRHTHIKHCYVLMENWPRYRYIIFCSEFCSTWNEYNYSSFLFIYVNIVCLSPSLYFYSICACIFKVYFLWTT